MGSSGRSEPSRLVRQMELVADRNIPKAAPAFEHKKFLVLSTGLDFTEAPDYEECSEFAPRVHAVENALQFVVGDFANYVERAFPEQASQILDAEMFNEASLRVYQWVCGQIPQDQRVPGLTFQHHKLVAAMAPEDRKRWLLCALFGEDGVPWSSRRLEQELLAASDDGDTGVTITRWVAVPCKSKAEVGEVKTLLESKGYTAIEQERRRKAKKKKPAVTARAKNPGKKRGRSRG